MSPVQLKTRKTKDGEKRISFDVEVDDVELQGGKRESSAEEKSGGTYDRASSNSDDFGGGGDDDIPF